MISLPEAERRARSNLYNLEANAALLEHKENLAETIRERGSRVEQRYDEKPGKVTGRYIEAFPSWLLELESVELRIWELAGAVSFTRGLLKYLREREPELFKLYAMKYRDGAAVPELKRCFSRKLDKLDRELIFRLIEWSSWRIKLEGAESWEKWRKDRRGSYAPPSYRAKGWGDFPAASPWPRSAPSGTKIFSSSFISRCIRITPSLPFSFR
jgi:hypothetical protein